MCARKLTHWASPMVWAPDKATMSLALRPLAENMEVSVDRLEDAAGIWELAALWLAVLASLRPSATVHDVPPNYTYTHIYLLSC